MFSKSHQIFQTFFLLDHNTVNTIPNCVWTCSEKCGKRRQNKYMYLYLQRAIDLLESSSKKYIKKVSAVPSILENRHIILF